MLQFQKGDRVKMMVHGSYEAHVQPVYVLKLTPKFYVVGTSKDTSFPDKFDRTTGRRDKPSMVTKWLLINEADYEPDWKFR